MQCLYKKGLFLRWDGQSTLASRFDTFRSFLLRGHLGKLMETWSTLSRREDTGAEEIAAPTSRAVDGPAIARPETKLGFRGAGLWMCYLLMWHGISTRLCGLKPIERMLWGRTPDRTHKVCYKTGEWRTQQCLMRLKPPTSSNQIM